MLWLWQDAPYHNATQRTAQFRKFKRRFGLPDELPQDAQRSDETGAAIAAMVERIYGELSIIDGKVGALTQASSVLLFIASLALTPGSGFAAGTSAFVMIVASFFAFFLAVLFCLSVVFLHWFRFDHSAAKATNDELLLLLKIRNGRTRRYRYGWLLTFLGAVVIAAAFLLSALSRIHMAPPSA